MFNHLTTRTYNDEHTREESLVICSVCLTDLKKGQETLELSCKHKFHDTCMKEWLLSNGSCPNCRFNIVDYIKSNVNLAQPIIEQNHIEVILEK